MNLYAILVLAARALTRVPETAGPGGIFTSAVATHDDSALIAGLVIGIPSVIIAVASYYLATRANRTTEAATREKVDAEAYTRAQSSYESHISDLRQQVSDLREDVDRVKKERDTALSDLAEANTELRRTVRKVTEKRHELDDLDTSGT